MKRAWDPSTDELLDALRGACGAQEVWEESLNEACLGEGPYDTPGENLSSATQMLLHYDEAIPDMIFALAWRFVGEDREPDLAGLYEVVDDHLAYFERLQEAGRQAEGWRFDGDEDLTAARKQLWEAARVELGNQIGQAREERERRQRGGTGARLGRAARRLVRRDH